MTAYAMTYDDHPAEWYERRVGLVTSSIAPAIFGACKYNSPHQAKMIIKGEHRGAPSAATYRGQRLEPAVLQVGAEWAGMARCDYPGPLLVEPADFRRHPNGWSGDSTDACYVHPQTGEMMFIAEGKTVAGNEVDEWGTPGTDQVPDRVLIQTCWHLAHWPEVDACIVPVLLASRYSLVFECYEVKRNPELIGTLMQDAEKWHHDYIIQDLDPPVDHRDLDAMKRRHPRAFMDAMDWSPELEALASEKVKWAKVAKEAGEKEDAAKADIIKLMGGYGSARSDKISITFRNKRDSQKINWQKLARHLGATDAQVEEFTETVSGARSLTVTALKNKDSES